MIKRQKPEIEFITYNFLSRKEYPVKPAKEFIPQEWKNISRSNEFGEGTIKACPGISDWMMQGYIIPAWTDMEVVYNEFGPDLKLGRSGTGSAHPPYQCEGFLDSKSHYGGSVKLPCNWYIKTAPGWSIMILPLWYHKTLPDMEAMPGIIHSDEHHTEVNINFILKTKENFSVKAGTPLVQIVPFKRQNVHGVSRAATDIDKKRHNLWLVIYTNVINGITKFYKKKTQYTLERKDLDFEESLKYPLEHNNP